MERLTDIETLQLETETRMVAAVARYQNWQAGIDGILFQAAELRMRLAALQSEAEARQWQQQRTEGRKLAPAS